MTEARRLDHQKAPFPWFGGKQHAAPAVWEALGDVDHYVEPFMGTLAVLLRRPHLANRTYHSETVNDADALLVNFWRAVRADPGGVAGEASWPVSEVDLMARQLWLVERSDDGFVGRLRADPGLYDVRAAGWWVWGVCSWIGGGFADRRGPWAVDPATGGVVKQAPGTPREPGVGMQIPHLGDDGQGVNHPQTREPGVVSKRPHSGDGGRGVNTAALREPGVGSRIPHFAAGGRGVLRPQIREPGVEDEGIGWHPMTMPELANWLGYLAARLRHVRIIQGDWSRAVTGAVAKTLPVRYGKGAAGIFLDPPYEKTERASNLYAHDRAGVATDVHAWCAEHGDDPSLRIVLAGFDTEHTALEARGWRVTEWYKPGFLRGGYSGSSKGGTQMHRDRLWLSPHCLEPAAPTAAEYALFPDPGM